MDVKYLLQVQENWVQIPPTAKKNSDFRALNYHKSGKVDIEKKRDEI